MSLVLLAHGSVNPAGPRMVELLAARVRLRLPGVTVRPAYVAAARPTLDDVLVDAGRDVVVASLLCAPALDRAEQARPSVLLAEPLGPDRLLAGVQLARLREAGARPGQPVVMVGPGAELLGSQRDSVRAAQLLQELWGGPVRTAQLTGRGERMSQVVAHFRSRDLAPPVVSPYLVAPGHLLTKARLDARSLGLDLVADVLGDHPHVAEAVARRYRATTARQFALTLREGFSSSAEPSAAVPWPHVDVRDHPGRPDSAAGVRPPARFRRSASDSPERVDPACPGGLGCARHVHRRPGRSRRDGHLPGASTVRDRPGEGSQRHRCRGTRGRLRAVPASYGLGQARRAGEQVRGGRPRCRRLLGAQVVQAGTGGQPHGAQPLFVPDEEVVYRDEVGVELVENAHRFVSKLAAQRFLGYLQSQRAAMTGEVGAHTNRPELVAIHGYDTKYAMHALRLGFQGIELLTTGRISLPVPEPEREYLRSVRRGEVPLEEVIGAVTAAEARLGDLRDDADIPEEPDRAWVDDWLHRSLTTYWQRTPPS